MISYTSPKDVHVKFDQRKIKAKYSIHKKHVPGKRSSMRIKSFHMLQQLLQFQDRLETLDLFILALKGLNVLSS